MMTCPACGSSVENDALSCWNCFANFKPPSDNQSSAQTSAQSPLKRPDGTVLIGMGTAILVISAMLFLLSLTRNTDSIDGLGSAFTLVLVSAGLFQLGLILSLAGIIVRAMWFIPGEEEKVPRRP